MNFNLRGIVRVQDCVWPAKHTEKHGIFAN
jgi:hypothetical protein